MANGILHSPRFAHQSTLKVMFPKSWALIITMLAGAAAQHVEDADNLVDNMIDILVDKLNYRVGAALRAQDEGLDSTTLGKGALAMQAGPGTLAIPKAGLPAPMQAGMQPQKLNPMLNGGLDRLRNKRLFSRMEWGKLRNPNESGLKVPFKPGRVEPSSVVGRARERDVKALHVPFARSEGKSHPELMVQWDSF